MGRGKRTTWKIKNLILIYNYIIYMKRLKKEEIEKMIVMSTLWDESIWYDESFKNLDQIISTPYIKESLDELKLLVRWLKKSDWITLSQLKKLSDKSFWNELITLEIKHDKEELLKMLDMGEYEKPTYLWLSDLGVFYHVESWNQHSAQATSINLNVKQKDLNEMVWSNVIPKYKKLYYGVNPPHNCYNLLNTNKILKPCDSKNDIAGVRSCEIIKKLVSNVFGNKKENIEWGEKTLWYKYNNINDVMIPAVILYWNWWTWKGLFFKLMKTIFWDENVLDNLTQKDLLGEFSTYQGRKLVVEFAEISSYNTNLDKQALNNLKNLIFASEITINRKHEAQYQTNNLAWFFITSNNLTPVVLETADQNNRRFSVIKTWEKLDESFWFEAYNAVNDIAGVRRYLKYLEEKYGKDLERPIALKNIDKNDLIEKSKSDSVIFFESIWEKYDWKRVLGEDVMYDFEAFCKKSWIEFDIAKRYLRKDLPNFVEYKKMRIAWTPVYWFEFKEFTWEKYEEDSIKLAEVTQNKSDLFACKA